MSQAHRSSHGSRETHAGIARAAVLGARRVEAVAPAHVGTDVDVAVGGPVGVEGSDALLQRPHTYTN